MTAALTIPSADLTAPQALVLLREVRHALGHAEQILTDRYPQPIDRVRTLGELQRLDLLRQYGTGASTFVVVDVDGALLAWRTYAEQLASLTGGGL